MKNLLIVLTILGLFAGGCNLDKNKKTIKTTHVEINNGWYFINGQKTFINALGYEIGARPGQHPKEPRNLELARMRNDLQLIKKAGFNAVRTWDVLYKEELELVKEEGLLLIFGIEVNSHGDFASEEFIINAIHQVDTALSYSKDFDNIVTYLIMNEPMPKHIREVGAQATVDLWKKLISIIHEKHPGIPVTISGNSAITEYINMNVFDIYAYNAYDYDEGINYALGYANANRFLKDMNGEGKPLILTEFGFSVSRQGTGKYGGNTEKAQKDGLIRYYRNLLDGGAVGACPFYYADGWWKGGEPAIHNDTPEEWFGFWGYSDVKDTIGHPRPVWYALSKYNQALISSPKNQQYYKNDVPMEIFTQNNVAGMKVLFHDAIIYENNLIEPGFFTDTLSFKEGLTDRELIFEFYGKDNQLLKCESIIILTGKEDIVWPTLKISTPVTDLSAVSKIPIAVTLTNDTLFTLSDKVRFIFQHHIGWQPGQNQEWTADITKKEQKFEATWDVNKESPVLGIYTGTDIRYGKFIKTIFDYKFIYPGDWAEPVRVK